MPQTQPGVAPSGLALIPYAQGGGAIQWPAVPGAVAYTVDRAEDYGTIAWTTLGSSCSGSTTSLKFATSVPNGPVQPNHVGFLDITGTTPRLRYVYRVRAFDAAGRMGWSSIRWRAPHSGDPKIYSSKVTGSTVELNVAFWTVDRDDNLTASERANFDFHGGRPPDQFVVNTSYGVTTPFVASSVRDIASPEFHLRLTSVPEGTHTFTVNAYWTLLWDGTLPRVVSAKSTSAQITVKP
jgi:hypothetical protein